MMKKFTFIATLLLAFASMAHAELMDKYFFKIATDKNPGWTIQDASNTVMTYDKEALTVQQKKNAGRMLNYFFNDAAWQKDILTSHPTYKFTMDLKMTNMAARGDMEFVLLPVNACTSTDNRVATHNYHWANQQDAASATEETTVEDFFFRWRVMTAPTEANGDYTIIINEQPKGYTTAYNKYNLWPTTENADSILTLSSQKLYKYSVVIDTKAKAATYTIADENGTVIKTGVHNYVCAEDRAGIFVYSTNGTSTAQLSNMGLCYEAEGPFANEPSLDLFYVDKVERDYYAQFKSGEVLHWIQLGDADDVVSGTHYEDGQEYTVAYGDARDSKGFEEDPDAEGGQKIIYCETSGTLRAWTSMESDDSNVSDEVTAAVECTEIQLPAPVATITNVTTGYGKEYTITADNSSVTLNPTITIHYKMSNGQEGNMSTGETLTFTDAGSVELYSWDGTHPTPCYSQSETVTVENNVEYVTYTTRKYDVSFDEAKTLGLTEADRGVDLKDGAAQSHWERIYSEEKKYYDADGNTVSGEDAEGYSWTKSGFGVISSSEFLTGATWKVYYTDETNYQTAFSPIALTGGTATSWAIFPLEGIVYDSTSGMDNGNYCNVYVESKYTSDDSAKPNFFIVHTRGGYDRPDKGDCNATTVMQAGEAFQLYRFDTAICDVRIMTYKGFDPAASINGITADETSAPAVKKVVTKNGIVIVKGDKAYSVAGAQIK